MFHWGHWEQFYRNVLTNTFLKWIKKHEKVQKRYRNIFCFYWGIRSIISFLALVAVYYIKAYVFFCIDFFSPYVWGKTAAVITQECKKLMIMKQSIRSAAIIACLKEEKKERMKERKLLQLSGFEIIHHNSPPAELYPPL